MPVDYACPIIKKLGDINPGKSKRGYLRELRKSKPKTSLSTDSWDPIREYAGDKLTNGLDSSREIFHTITHSRVHTFLCDYMKV